MIFELALVALITLIPFFELRASIPIGLLQNKIDLPFGLSFGGFGLPLAPVFAVAIGTNILLGPIIYSILNKFTNYFLRFSLFSVAYNKIVRRTRKKVSWYIDRYGGIGFVLFIGMPFPGSGSYSGALGAYLLGLKFRKFILANTLGVLIAGTIVTLITLGVINL